MRKCAICQKHDSCSEQRMRELLAVGAELLDVSIDKMLEMITEGF
mgnify:CR=1 FL=1